MEPGRGSEPTSKTKPLSGGCEEMARRSEAPQPVVEPLSECPDASPPEPQPQPPGRLRKTAFKLFGGRKSICALPSFFGGRNKSQGKGSSKKGMSKSKTHDCISKASLEDGRGAGYVPAGDVEFRSQKASTRKTLTNSLSAHAMADPGKRTEFPKSHLLASEVGDHKLGVDKSLSFPRPKKGLKGLFSSIRRHRKNKNAESEKSEIFEMSVDIPIDLVPVYEPGVNKNNGKYLDSLAEPNVPVVMVKDGFIITHECIEDAILSENDISQIKGDSEPLKEGQISRDAVSQEEGTRVLNAGREALCSKPEFSCPHNLSADYAENDQPSFQSSDQISLIFGDVASLKSFDSLTGCGDIIADQDDDSVAEGSVSGERSRSAGKRSSCYVTYQGGGEEMATPDEVDEEYLQGLWENDAAADVCYASSQLPDFMERDERVPPAMASSVTEVPSSPTFPRTVVEVALTPGDVSTPQSDHQESVPNSDEGYYDSTTPGPDDDGDRVCTLGSERLPRDSYSGDALYELFEPDDSLMSPPIEDGSSFETQPPTPDSLEYLGVALQISDTKLHPGFSRKSGLMETEEARLAKIQQELLCCELQNMQKAPKEPVVLAKDRFYYEKSLGECIPKLNKPHQACPKDGQVISEIQCQKENKSMRPGSYSLKESQTESVPCNIGSSQKTHDKPVHVKAAEAVSGMHSLKTPHSLQEPSLYTEQDEQRPILTENRGENYRSSKGETGTEHDQTVCFSQALVDFTKHAELFNSLSGGLEGSESSSSFARNIDALPAMVTFDIVDMENEGECDRQTDMVTDEDVVSPHEAYDESYLQKGAFADCERMFDFCDQSLFLCNAWGIASLPRRLSLTRVNQPMPAPLSSNRRSKSLDTDSLEFELSGMHLGQSKASPSSISTPRAAGDSERASSLHRKRTRHSASSETRATADLTPASWQREPRQSFVCQPTDGKRAHQVQGLVPAQKGRAKPACGPTGRPEALPAGRLPGRKTRPQGSKLATEERGACNPTPQSPGHLTRPSHLPLQSGDCGPQAQCTLTGASRERLCDRADRVSNNRGEAYFSNNYASTQYSDFSRPHTKVKPIGVTQGMPHFSSDTSGASKPAIFQEHREFVKKGRKSADVASPAECNKRTT